MSASELNHTGLETVQQPPPTSVPARETCILWLVGEWLLLLAELGRKEGSAAL